MKKKGIKARNHAKNSSSSTRDDNRPENGDFEEASNEMWERGTIGAERSVWQNNDASGLREKKEPLLNSDEKLINEQLNDLVTGLRCKPVTIPVRFLYDHHGSNLYQQITKLEEYYPYLEEKSLLADYSNSIVDQIPLESVIVELGCGDGSKTALLLNALAHRRGSRSVQYIGIDVSQGALDQALQNMRTYCPDVAEDNFGYICAEYVKGLRLARSRHPHASLCILWLGSSIGNFTFNEAKAFLQEIRCIAGDNSAIILCCDLWKRRDILESAYDDSHGITKKFIINGVDHALRTLNHPDSTGGENLWKYKAIVNEEKRQVEMWLTARRKIHDVIPGVDIESGESILMEISRKFCLEDIAGLAQESGYYINRRWTSSRYSIQFLVPYLEAFRRCWSETEAIFDVVPDWYEQPIGLRHPFCFYYGHVAAFSRLKMLPNGPVRPLDKILCRGIDPNVLDPSKCHDHPTVPESWPPKEEIIAYVKDIRKELQSAFLSSSEAHELSSEACCMVLEHERMHQETLCYMLSQGRKQRFSENVKSGDFDPLSKVEIMSPELPGAGIGGISTVEARQAWTLNAGILNFYFDLCGLRGAFPSRGREMVHSPSNSDYFIRVTEGKVKYGIPAGERCGFVWDNECGTCGPTQVGSFDVGYRQITVAEFLKFVIEDHGYDQPDLWKPEDLHFLRETDKCMPATWSRHPSTGDIWVHMPEGSYHWTDVAHCPVFCSLAEAEAYARKYHARIMTEAEYEHLSRLKRSEDPLVSLVVGIAEDEALGWEWTSSVFEPLDGFVENPLYPEYSIDFFDGEHYVLRGTGSAYTHPCMRRNSFRNFYQR